MTKKEGVCESNLKKKAYLYVILEWHKNACMKMKALISILKASICI